MIHAHVPWTRVLDDVETQKGDWRGRLLALARAWREHLVLKPNDEYGGTGVKLGWEMTEGQWDTALEAALEDPYGTWIVQERIPVRREVFPQFDATGRITMTRHAGGPGAVPVSRPHGRLPHAVERDRPRQRDVRRRPGARVRG